MLKSVDCQWADWQTGECSKKCEGGIRTNKRGKFQEELYGGKTCEGNSTFEEECNVQECPGIYKLPKKVIEKYFIDQSKYFRLDSS